MNHSPILFPPKAYCPLLIRPDFALPGGKDSFIPFEAYKDGCFLFHIGEEYVVMDTLGREIKRVRAQSASLEKSCPADGKQQIHISLHYTCDEEQKTTLVRTYDAPRQPEAKPSGYYIFKKGIFSSSYGIKDSQGNVIIPAEYDGFVRKDPSGLFVVTEGSVDFCDGFVIARKNRSEYIYLDQEGKRLIPFIRGEKDRPLVQSSSSMKAVELFCGGLAYAQFWGDEEDATKVVMNTSGRCLHDRTWDNLGKQCGDLIPVYSKEDGGWTLLRRDGEIFDTYYEEIYLTCTGPVFVPDGQGGYRCIIPFSGDNVESLCWQKIQMAEPGLLWAWRDGRHELIDCRENRTDFLSLYDQPIARTHDVSWEKHDWLYLLSASGAERIRMTADEFKAYIDYLEKDCGLHNNFIAGPVKQEDTQVDEYYFGFDLEGSRLHAPIDVHNGIQQKTCSLIINYCKTDDGFAFFLIAAGKPCPSVAPAEDLIDKRIHLSDQMIATIRNWHTWHYSKPFCDYLKEDLSEYDPDKQYNDSDNYPLDTTRV